MEMTRMKNVFVVADNIFSPLGISTEENMRALEKEKTGVKRHADFMSSGTDVFASLFDDSVKNKFPDIPGFTKFENLLTASITDALRGTEVKITDPKTILIISTTKGNIGMLESFPIVDDIRDEISLSSSANKVAKHFGNPNVPIVVSNACISGLAALLVGKRLIQSGKFQNAIVAGADLITRFVQSGFESFQAISTEVCKPFDIARTGINLGEAAATIVLSESPAEYGKQILFSGGAISNDANHISGPSRTGEELALAIRKALTESSLDASDIDFISAHGTATVYNDEMEAKAFGLSGLTEVPVNSLKGYYGHTLGAAGLVESVITINCMKENILFPTYGFQNPGVSVLLNVCDKMQYTKINHAIKTASGFGGCNAALVFSRT